jgi:hypothetical protein
VEERKKGRKGERKKGRKEKRKEGGEWPYLENVYLGISLTTCHEVQPKTVLIELLAIRHLTFGYSRSRKTFIIAHSASRIYMCV